MESKDQKKKWIPPNPSTAQIRAALTEYCILPNGSSNLKKKLAAKDPPISVRGVMLYGPSGAGKTMMVEAIANHLGAMLINFSPNSIKDKADILKSKPEKLIHAIYKVSVDDDASRELGKTNPLAPVVVYMDNCEEIVEN